MKLFGKLMVVGVILFAALQALRPGIPSKPATAELQATPEVRHVFEKDCYSCHSDQRRLAWFDRIVPAYWLVRHDILTAREHLNFSTLGSKPAGIQKATLYEAVNMIQLGAMPLPSFVRLHPEAKVTPEDLAAVKAYLAPWTTPLNTAVPPEVPAPVSLETVAPELNGVPFDAAFEKWKLLSTTDRGDNNTVRFILGNDVAMQAAQTGNILPWPDGARFAKIAWQQERGPDGLIHPGSFVQVELMLKNAQLYKDTEGWGWGRWRGLDLEPYGKDAHFVTECTSCHLPLRGNDYVYSLLISIAKVPGQEVVNNAAAMLPASLPYQPLGWSPITMYVDPATRTMAALFGNSAAEQAAHANRTPSYPAGALLALVIWAQRDDPHWFGARIPDAPKSVEFVQVSANGQPASYRHFAGAVLAEDQGAAKAATLRTTFILGLAPARLP